LGWDEDEKTQHKPNEKAVKFLNVYEETKFGVQRTLIALEQITSINLGVMQCEMQISYRSGDENKHLDLLIKNICCYDEILEMIEREDVKFVTIEAEDNHMFEYRIRMEELDAERIELEKNK
jgi:hypothetical protein